VCDTAAEAEVALHAAERAVSVEVECGICLETVLAQAGRRFGLLSHCTHAFCLDCIRAWRARIDLPKETTRGCPVCRTISYYVIACDRFIAEGPRKAAANADFARATRSIPCRHFDYGRGTCPFGSSCFYAHLNFDGTPHVSSGAHGFRLDAEGNVSGAGGKAHKLSDFL
jgi:E3 ubiquitin-protein ligase makorin